MYKSEFWEAKVSLNGNKRINIYTYYYPDSIPAYRLYEYEEFSKPYKNSPGSYVLTDSKTVVVERKTPYIPPIDTIPIESPVLLEEMFFSRGITPQSITFKAESRFTLYGEGMSTCTMTPKYYVHGKYIFDGEEVTLYYQRDQSLEIDTTRYLYYPDSLSLIETDDNVFRTTYYSKPF